MERKTAFVPPPFLGSGFRQNHQIRALKSNSLPFLSSHRSLLHPSRSHTSPSLSLLTSRSSSSFSRTNLTSQRRSHLRRCYDLFHVSLQRRDPHLAARFLRVLLGAHEWTSHLLWQWALCLVQDRLGYLKQLDLEGSSAFKASYTTAWTVSELVAARRINDAIELLEQRVNVHPYKARAELHGMLGMLYVFVGMTAVISGGGGEGGGGELRGLDRTTRGKARMCFETALQVEGVERRAEEARRRRVWGVRCGEEGVDAERVRNKRLERLWGSDVLDGWEGEVVEEHESIRRVRRRLNGEPEEEEEADTRRERDNESEDEQSSASGSLYSDQSGSDSVTEEEERGRSRTPSRLAHQASPPASNSPTPPAAPTKGPQAWARAWSSVSSFYTPDPPLASHLARAFLALLDPSSATASQGGMRRDGGSVAEEDEDEGDGTFGGVELTREEAELRLRRILFEGEEDGDEASGSRGRRGEGERAARDGR